MRLAIDVVGVVFITAAYWQFLGSRQAVSTRRAVRDRRRRDGDLQAGILNDTGAGAEPALDFREGGSHGCPSTWQMMRKRLNERK
jgi:hypothetical protein